MVYCQCSARFENLHAFNGGVCLFLQEAFGNEVFNQSVFVLGV